MPTVEWATDAWIRLPLVVAASAYVGAVREIVERRRRRRRREWIAWNGMNWFSSILCSFP